MGRVETIPITDRNQWLALRRRDVTASDVAAVANFSNWRSRYRVRCEKLGLAAEEPETNIMRRGRWLEHAGLAALAELHPDWKISRAGVYLRDVEDRIGATPDGLGEGNGAPFTIEVKATALPVYDAWEWDEEANEKKLPIEYQCQALTQAMLADVPQTIVAVLTVDTW